MTDDQAMPPGPDDSGHGDRPRCGSKTRSGGTCTQAAGWGTPHPGIGRCKLHGGSTPNHVESATQQQAAATIEKLWPGLAGASPVKDPVGSMERLAGALEEMLERTGTKVNELSHVSAGRDLTQLRGELVLLDKVTGHLRALLESMARLGIAERYVQLEEERASIVVAAFVGALEVLVLVPADKDLVTRRFLELLGDVVPGEVVAS